MGIFDKLWNRKVIPAIQTEAVPPPASDNYAVGAQENDDISVTFSNRNISFTGD